MSIVVMSEPAQQFETVFRENARLIYRTAYGVTGSHQDAEDVLQSVFLQLMQQELPPDLRKNPRTYLYRAAVNTSLNLIRSRRREVLIENNELLEGPSQFDSENKENEVQRLYDAIAELKPESAQILLLRYMHNKTDVEIARMQGRSRGAIALNLFRSRARLRKLLSQTQGDAS